MGPPSEVHGAKCGKCGNRLPPVTVSGWGDVIERDIGNEKKEYTFKDRLREWPHD